MTIEFKFEIDQKVYTPFNRIGMVTSVGYDGRGNYYTVFVDSGVSETFYEGKLRAMK